MSSAELEPIHPFPARMASEVAFSAIGSLPKRRIILDPMSGSGTVLRVSVESGHACLGFDLDPLAVLMGRVWTTAINLDDLSTAAAQVIDRAQALGAVSLPWIDRCAETSEFVQTWFEPRQRAELRRLSAILVPSRGPVADALRLALSRIIITKEKGASIARDTSHSRPHRVFFDNDYDIMEGLQRSVQTLSKRLQSERIKAPAIVNIGDVRMLAGVPDHTVDLVVTSPPYLNAIDYLRGHRLTLVWLGFGLKALRQARALSIGTEVSTLHTDFDPDHLLRRAGPIHELPSRKRGMVRRYAVDCVLMMRTIARVLKPGARAILVVGNSCLKDVAIANAEIVIAAAHEMGMRLIDREERELPTVHRYLPMPKAIGEAPLARRIRTETVLFLERGE